MSNDSYFTYDEDTNQGRLYVTLERCCNEMLDVILDYEEQDFKDKMDLEEVKKLAMQHFIKALNGLKGDIENAPRR